MGRRRHVALASAIVILMMGAVVAVLLVGLTGSARGRELIRAQAERALASVTKGRIHIGALTGSFLTDLTIDSLEFREPNDSLFLATGPLRVTFDPRDIADGVIFLRSLDVQRPFVRLQRRNDEWNYRSIFPSGGGGPAGPRRGFGSRIALTNVRIRGGEVRLALPWTPADSLRGARRDSAITRALADTSGGVRRIGPDEYEKEWKWTGIAAQLAHAHVADPDTSGHHFEVARLDMLERYPPFNVRNLSGTIWRRGDTLSLDIPRFELPGSAGNLKGRVVWGSGLPMRYDIRIHADTVSMADIAWVYETLPATGGGRMDLHIKNERDLHVMDYVIRNMDVRTTHSRLRGSMTFGVGAPVLIVKDVALEALPVDFRLIEQFSGEPLPLPWRGAITGTVRARGGPVNRWQLDEGRFTFADANVPGAVTRGTLRGQLDILYPAFTAFHGATVELAQLDLRTLQYLDPEFPRLHGFVAGRAVLDSSWLDVRFREGDFTHHDGDAPVSHFQGSGRVTTPETNMIFDLSFAAVPLSLTALSRSFPGLAARGEFSGPLRVKGTSDNLAVVADLVGDAGRLEVDGTFDVSEPGYRAAARGSASGLDLRRFLGRDDVPTTRLAFHWSSDVIGESLADLRGTAALHMDRSLVDSVRVFGGDMNLRFLSGTLAVDSLTLESAAFSASARGRLSLAPGHGVGDSVSFRVTLDSLGGFRHTVANTLTKADSGAAPDTSALDGSVRIDGTLGGEWPTLRLSAAARGTDLRVGSTFAKDIEASVRLSFPLDSLRGTAHVRAEGLTLGGVRVNTIDATAEVPSPGRAVTELKAELSNGPVATARADVGWSRDTTSVRLDRFRLATGDNDWALLAPAGIARIGAAWTVDSLVLLGRTAGRISVRGAMPDLGEMAATFDATDVPLADIGELVQVKSPLSGRARLNVRVAGTREAPQMAFSSAVSDALVAGIHVELAEATGRYADRRVEAAVRAVRQTVTAVRADATIPVDLSFRSVPRRLLAEAPLRAAIRSDSAGVALLELLTPEVTKARGVLALEAALSGTMKRPLLNGALRITDGGFDLPGLGTVWHGMDADVAFVGDSIAVRHVTVHSGDARATSTLSGWLGFRDMDDPRFDLRLSAQNFNVINKARVADLDMSGALRVAGATSRSALTGELTVDRGTVFIPDIFSKELISLDDPELRNIVDTVALADHGILPRAPSRVVENLFVNDVPVGMGRDVKIRSSEANITLGGAVRITAARVRRGRDAGRYQLALDGTLQTVRGSYRLNAGPVQRTFDVEGGEIRFRGDPDPNLAEMDIRALHTVRTFSQSTARQDVRVRVNIGGTLGSPRASFSTPDSSRVSDSDILSYLVTGGPSNEILGRSGGDVSTTAYRVALSSLGSVIGSKWSGGLCDDAQFSTASLDQYNVGTGKGLRDVGSSLLSGSRFNCAKQLGERVFFRVDAGLCSIGQLMGQGGSSSLFDALGFKFDYRFNYGVTSSAGMDPSTNAALCNRDAVVRGFVPTPRQFGLDLFRAWQF